MNINDSNIHKNFNKPRQMMMMEGDGYKLNVFIRESSDMQQQSSSSESYFQSQQVEPEIKTIAFQNTINDIVGAP